MYEREDVRKLKLREMNKMDICTICKVASECEDRQADNSKPEPDLYLSACNYRSAEEYIQCTGN